VPTGSHDHSQLHKTLQAWADIYRDGILGKERIIVNHALTQPAASSRQDDFVGRILWALSDKSGLPAKRFADFNPVPVLDWLLEAFSDERFGYHDLKRFNVPPHAEVDLELRFSLIRRPAAYNRTPPMWLVSPRGSSIQWDEVMFHLARWLTRHLDDPRLIIWIAKRGNQLHERWQWLVELQLDRIASLELERKTAELDEIRSQAPKAIPSPLMRILWRLLLSGTIKSPWDYLDIYSWKNRVKREGLTTTLRLELRQLLAPKISLKEPFRWKEDYTVAVDPTRIRHLVDWELVLAANNVQSALHDIADEELVHVLPRLLQDFQQLLCDALDLLSELGDAEERSDRSYWDLPSITPHWQNRGFQDWVSLIELLRDSWLALHSEDRTRATWIAQEWFNYAYPTFKRLALFAAGHTGCITPEQWVNWLLADNAWWLWTVETGREVFRLLVLQGQNLAATEQEKLETAMLAGPPREMFRTDIDADEWQRLVEHSVWLHLAKLNASGIALGAAAKARLAELSTSHPLWQLAVNESDEFSHWMSGTGDPDYEDEREVDIAPRKRHELVQWLRQQPREQRSFYEDTWRDVCRSRFFHSLYALNDLARENEWPIARWREALQVWSEDAQISRSWKYAAPLVHTMPDAILQELINGVTWWMEAVSKSSTQHLNIMLDLCRRVLDAPFEINNEPSYTRNGIEVYNPVSSAINHPIGHATHALINLWLKTNPNDNDLLPESFRSYFTELCDARIDHYRHGRVLLGSRLITFFRVDRSWTEQCLLPLLNWSNSVEAKAAWEGFLWSPRIYQPLLAAFKSNFLETAHHYADLGEHRPQFAAFLTYAALGSPESYTRDEFRAAIEALPQEGLEKCAQALSQALEGAADQREDYWRNRIQPFWQNVWPKSRNLATTRIAESLARLVIAARLELPAALTAVQDWLQPLEHPDYVVHLLEESDLCLHFPVDSLQLLAKVISNQQWIGGGLEKCLDQIEKTMPPLAQDTQYQRLRNFSRTRAR